MNKSAYVVKAFPDGKDRWKEFQEKGIIAIGWPALSDLSGKSREEIKKLLCNKYGLEGQSLGSAVSQIYAFCVEISTLSLSTSANRKSVTLLFFTP